MKKIAVIAAAAVLFLSPAFMSMSASAQPARWLGMGMMDDNPLNLTPEQEKTIEELWKARMEKMSEFRDGMMKLQLEMNELMRDSKADAKKIDGLIDRMSALRAEHQKEAFRHRRSVENVLTPEQVEKLQLFRGRFAGRLAGRGMMPGRGGFGMGMMSGIRGMRGGWCLMGLDAWDDYPGHGFMSRSFGRGMTDRFRRPARGMGRRW